MRSLRSVPVLLALSVLTASCGDESEYVVVYTALDRSFSEPIFEMFTEKTGIRVRAQYDTESTKTVGLTNRIRAEKKRPRCDVFWNNEILNTLRLKQEGFLEKFVPAEAENYPDAFKDAEGYWHGFAARARVLIVNIELVKGEDFPKSVVDLADPRFRGQTGIAKPLFGTTASHVACLFATMGDEKATAFLRSLTDNKIQIHGGNKGCATAVSAGQAAFALTDTDDAIIELVAGKPVRIVYPDSAANEMGTLFLPNTLALVKGSPNPEAAKKLIDFLLSEEVETALANGPSAQIPLRKNAEPNPRVKNPGELEAIMKVDFSRAAAAFDTARKVVEERFLR